MRERVRVIRRQLAAIPRGWRVLVGVVALGLLMSLVAWDWTWGTLTAGEATAFWTALIAAATLVGLGGLVTLYQQLQDARRRMRVELSPYLRIDLAPEVPGGTWTPPVIPAEEFTDLTFEALNPEEPVGHDPLAAWAGDIPIYLWVRNLQPNAYGVADNVEVGVLLRVPDASNPDASPWDVQIPVRFRYLEANHLNRYLVARVSPTVPWLAGLVDSVRYTDVYGNRRTFAHGVVEFFWEPPTVVHQRDAFRDGETA